MKSLKRRKGRSKGKRVGGKKGRREETLYELKWSDFQDLLLREKSYGTVYKEINKNIHTNTHLFVFTKQNTERINQKTMPINGKGKNRFRQVYLFV